MLGSMWLPCEYCGRSIKAETFVRMGVSPCCDNCVWIPRLVTILFFAAMTAFLIWAYND